MAEAVALSYDTFKAQMKDIAEKSVHIGVGGFVSVDEDDFLSKVKSRSTAVMVLEPVFYRNGDSNTEYILEYMRCGFTIYLPFKQGKYAENDANMALCKTISRKVMTRIRKNTYGRVPAGELPKFRNLNVSSIKGEPAKLAADGRIGYYCEFEIHYQISLAYHTEDWTD